MNLTILSDDGKRALAKELAPLIAEELGLNRHEIRRITPSEDYDAGTCAAFVESLGDSVLDNGLTFWQLLAKNGEAGSLDVTAAIGVARPSVLPFVLTTPLKRRAKALGLISRPWLEDTSSDNRTIWRDRDGIAERMIEAINKEKARRTASAA
jgi:hypothetical protein